jgi:hypothetical protein
MSWIDHGYELQWLNGAPAHKEARNSPSALAHAEVVTSALSEILAAGAISKLSTGNKPPVMSPLGVVPKGNSGKSRLIINMRYVNEHLICKKFKFEGLSDLADMAKKETLQSRLTLPQGTTMWDYTHEPALTRASIRKGSITYIYASHLGWLQPLKCFLK